MKIITIKERVTWLEQIDWITTNCPGARDMTNWAMWSLGLDDILYMMEESDAVVFKLKFRI
jgi:hypothetical protein